MRRLGPDVAWIAFWGLLSSAGCLLAARGWSGTFDEPFYLTAGLEHWRTGSCGQLMRAGTMPLPVDLQTLPVRAWELFRGERFDPEADIAAILPLARATNLVFWWMLLVGSWRLARHQAGPWAGRLAVPALALDPTLAAHAALATTDIAVAAATVWLIDHLVRRASESWWQRVGVTGLWYAACILCKASGLIFGALAIAVVGLWRLHHQGAFSGLGWRGRELWRRTHALRKQALQAGLVGVGLVFLYCGTEGNPERSFVKWAQALPEGSAGRSVMLPVAENLRIFPNAGVGIAFQVKHNMKGHGTFILGESHEAAVRHYFPVALSMKLTIPVLVLLLLACRRGGILADPVGWIAVIMFLMSVNYRVQIGIRIVMPLVVLLIVAAAEALGRWLNRLPQGKSWAAVLGVSGLLAIPQAATYPNGISYFNRLWGGPERGYRLLSDSNYDWGQGLLELGEWQRAHADRPLKIWYFGLDPRAKQSPFELLQLHGEEHASLDDFPPLVNGGYLAVSTTLLYGNDHIFTPWSKQVVGKLRGMRPVGRTETFIIYDGRDW